MIQNVVFAGSLKMSSDYEILKSLPIIENRVVGQEK